MESLLKKYIDLFDNINRSKSADQKDYLIDMLIDAINEMASSSEFNAASGQLTTLQTQLSSDFNEHSDYYNQKIAQVRQEG